MFCILQQYGFWEKLHIFLCCVASCHFLRYVFLVSLSCHVFFSDHGELKSTVSGYAPWRCSYKVSKKSDRWLKWSDTRVHACAQSRTMASEACCSFLWIKCRQKGVTRSRWMWKSYFNSEQEWVTVVTRMPQVIEYWWPNCCQISRHLSLKLKEKL